MDEHKYKESGQTREIKSEIAQEKPRDSEGHFIHKDPPASGEQIHQNPVNKFLSEHTHYSKTSDDLLDVHVGNPLHKIVTLLEDIKKQKAFSFTLKGSLGIAGVALALGIFGIFGASNLLCYKGVQKEIGVVKVLNVMEYDREARLPIFSNLIDLISPRTQHNSMVLVKNDQSVISLPYSKDTAASIQRYANYPVVATGAFDSCNQTLTVIDPAGIESYVK